MPATAQQSTIAYGDTGSVQTVHKMAALVNAAIRVPVVVEFAHHVVANVSGRDDVGLATAIADWMRANFKFVRDPLGVELLRTPEYMINQYNIQMSVSGDCDDAAILSAALAKSVGLAVRFVVLGFRAFQPFSHVYAIALTRSGKTVSFDTTKPHNVANISVARRQTFVV